MTDSKKCARFFFVFDEYLLNSVPFKRTIFSYRFIFGKIEDEKKQLFFKVFKTLIFTSIFADLMIYMFTGKLYIYIFTFCVIIQNVRKFLSM